MINKASTLSLIRELRRFMDVSYLEPYCGLYNVKVKSNSNPEDCAYIRLAAEKFFNEQFEEFKKIINQLHEEINA